MGTDSVIYIRTDGNSKIATGHLVRCLCIAQALESLNQSVCFLVSDTDSSALLQDLGCTIFQDYKFSYQIIILETAKYDNLELEIDELKALLSGSTETTSNTNFTSYQSMERSKPILFIDSYFVTEQYFSSLKRYAKIAYMDDLRAFDYKVDLVINYDVIPTSKISEYDKAYTNASIKLLGAQYTPLRLQFQNQEVNIKNNLQNILITTGGSDPYHFAETLISYLISQNMIADLHVVIGKLFKNTETLETLARENPSLHLHYNVSDMAALMKECDYAVSAAGTTLYELCALGIPCVSFSMADNQIPMAETFAATGAVPYAGDIRTQTKEELDSILTYIKEYFISLSNDFSKRQIQHKKMRQLVDGNGAIKIADALCKL